MERLALYFKQAQMEILMIWNHTTFSLMRFLGEVNYIKIVLHFKSFGFLKQPERTSCVQVWINVKEKKFEIKKDI